MSTPNYATLADQIAVRTAQRYGLDPNYFRSLFHAQINQESGFQPRVNSSAGAQGIAQIVPRYHPGVDPYNPQAALGYAANMDAQNFKKYGNWNDVLSIYNSGRGYSVGRNIPETRNYVSRILGAAGQPTADARRGSAQRAALPGGRVQPSPGSVGGMATPVEAQKQTLLAYLLGNLNNYAKTGTMEAVTPTSFLSAVQSQSEAPAPAPISAPAPTHSLASARGKFALTSVPTGFSTRPGIQVDQRILPEADTLAKRFGVRINSGYRSPEHNRSVGGASNSDHLRGDAVDFTGPQKNMLALYQYAIQHGYAYVEPWSQAGGNHVHISFRR
ncbi:MAG TPA: D-Ala-D-Ala carboxypeptidase family metallohydrolase [Candidatus Paceibacterota bacterium]